MKKILVCDIETNNAQGLDGKPAFDFFKDDPIQIAYALYALDGRKIIDNEIILKTPNLRPEIEKFTGITKAQCDAGVSHQVAATIWKNIFWNNDVVEVVGHNVIAFDWVILTNWLLRTLAGELFILPVIPRISDTMKRGSLMIGDRKWPKLSALARRLEIPVDESQLHNALYDIDLMAQVHFALQARGY